MKKVSMLLLTVFLLQGCTSQSSPTPPADTEKPPVTAPQQTPATTQPEPALEQKPGDQQIPDSYSNDIFKDVTVKKTGTDTFEVTGKAQVFEGVVSYVVEDGHNELTKGSFQTSAGAPAWGDFSHTINVKKAEANSTLTLILFETSMKDGSRRMEMIVPLPEK